MTMLLVYETVPHVIDIIIPPLRWLCMQLFVTFFFISPLIMLAFFKLYCLTAYTKHCSLQANLKKH